METNVVERAKESTKVLGNLGHEAVVLMGRVFERNHSVPHSDGGGETRRQPEPVALIPPLTLEPDEPPFTVLPRDYLTALLLRETDVSGADEHIRKAIEVGLLAPPDDDVQL